MLLMFACISQKYVNTSRVSKGLALFEFNRTKEVEVEHLKLYQRLGTTISSVIFCNTFWPMVNISKKNFVHILNRLYQNFKMQKFLHHYASLCTVFIVCIVLYIGDSLKFYLTIFFYIKC